MLLFTYSSSVCRFSIEKIDKNTWSLVLFDFTFGVQVPQLKSSTLPPSLPSLPSLEQRGFFLPSY
jgi:hypothetical protein